MDRSFLALFALTASSLLADGLVDLNTPPPPPEKTRPTFSTAPRSTSLRGIVLLPSQEYVNACSMHCMHGMEAINLDIPGGKEKLACILEPLFMGQAVSNDLLQRIKEEIVLYYRCHNYPVVAVYVPEQEITSGVLQLVVVVGCVGQIDVTGNRWFASRMYESFIRLGPGDAITADALMTGVSWLNRNPFRDVDVVFTPGCEPGQTNIELVVCDRFPIQVYGGGDNAGTGSTGTSRWYAGANWGDAFFVGGILNYQYTASFHSKEFESHTGHLTLPLPWRHLFIAYGGYSVVKPDLEEFNSRGSTTQASLRYTVPCGRPWDGVLHEWTLGFDFKNMNNNLLYEGTELLSIIADSVNIGQFMLGYAYGKETACSKTAFNLDIYTQPATMLPNQTDRKYEEFVSGASVKYIYGLMTVGHTWYLPLEFCLATLGRLQLASHPLLPSERFGIGGYDTVRGYLERQFNADDALVLNVELKFPPFSLLQFFGIDCLCDELTFLTFFDYGLGALNFRGTSDAFVVQDPGLGTTEYLMGVGPGLRYSIAENFAARVDWGFKLHDIPFGTKARSRFYIGVVLSF